MIWKALADPTRRSILNLLKKAPRTTGELSDQFEHLSRFAIMKHLGILEKAELVKTKREGKFRWNYLNIRPIQRTYDEWAANLDSLKHFTDSKSASMNEPDSSIRSATISINCLIKAARPKVWDALTLDISQWWLPSLFTHHETREFILEVKPGGLMYESLGENKGIVWANVTGIHPPHSLQLKGHLRPAHGGPAISFLSFQLEESGKSTVVHFKDELFGELNENTIEKLHGQWQLLLEDGLKKYFES